MEPLICPHCGERLFEDGWKHENYNGTADVAFVCSCGHSEIRTVESDEPPIETLIGFPITIEHLPEFEDMYNVEFGPPIYGSETIEDEE